MGNNQSTPSGPPEPTGAGSFVEGFRVLRVLKNGPGELAGLQPFFDFIVAADGVRLDTEKKDIFVKKIEATMGDTGHQAGIQLTIYNSREDGLRSTTLYPSSTWGGKGRIGISIRHTSIASAGELVWHILEVMPNSPASNAGLRSGSDYIVGSPEEGLTTPDDFYDLVETADKELELYVYNLEEDSARIISIVPNPRWGGSGTLGCTLGFGLLHRISQKAIVPSSLLLRRTIVVDTWHRPTIHSFLFFFFFSCFSFPFDHERLHRREHRHTTGSGSELSEDQQILLQQRLDAARAKRLAAESEEAELALKLSQLGPVNDQDPLPPVEPFPFEPSEYHSSTAEELTTSVDLSSAAVIEPVSTDIPLSHDGELDGLDPHHQVQEEEEEEEAEHHHEHEHEHHHQHNHEEEHAAPAAVPVEQPQPPPTAAPVVQPAPAAQPVPATSSTPSLVKPSSMASSAPLRSSSSASVSLQPSSAGSSPATGTPESPSRLEQGRTNIEQLAQKQRELTEKLRLLREATSKN